MVTIREDVLGATDYAWARLRHRLIGLTDAEWAWLPSDDAGLGVARRLQSLTELLRNPDNATRLGRAPGRITVAAPMSAVEAVAQLETAFAEWRGQLSGMDDAGLRAPVGAGTSHHRSDRSRLAFTLTLLDELTYRGAELAMLRTRYERRTAGAG